MSRDQITAVLAELECTRRASTVRTQVIPLRAGLSAAVEDNLVPANPAARLGKFFRSDVQPREKLDPFTREETTQLLTTAEAAMPEHYPAGSALGNWRP